MHLRRNHVEVPLPEEYTRVTNPERFESLHRIALEELDRLQMRFKVERAERDWLDPRLVPDQGPYRSVHLLPADRTAAPILLTFARPFGLVLRCGIALTLNIPGCTCDACNETLEGEAERLLDTIANVAGGRFREAFRTRWFGDAECQWEHWSSAQRAGGGERIPRSRLHELIGGRSHRIEWSPWPAR